MHHLPLPALVHRSALAVPLTAGARMVGVLYADMRAIFGQFTPADLDLLAVLASQATTALENARLYEETLCAPTRIWSAGWPNVPPIWSSAMPS